MPRVHPKSKNFLDLLAHLYSFPWNFCHGDKSSRASNSVSSNRYRASSKLQVREKLNETLVEAAQRAVNGCREQAGLVKNLPGYRVKC